VTARALALALLLALLVGCADGPSGARVIRSERTEFGRIDHWRMSTGEVRRLFTPNEWRPGGVRWLQPWELWPR
jgi:hypothetical protein